MLTEKLPDGKPVRKMSPAPGAAPQFTTIGARPPAMFSVAVPLATVQPAAVVKTDKFGGCGAVTWACAVIVQPFASVAVAVKLPGGKPVRGFWPEPGAAPQSIEKGAAPPVIVNKMEPFCPVQSVCVAVAAMFSMGGICPKTAVAESWQKFGAVTVTEKVAGEFTVCELAVEPFSHKKVAPVVGEFADNKMVGWAQVRLPPDGLSERPGGVIFCEMVAVAAAVQAFGAVAVTVKLPGWLAEMLLVIAPFDHKNATF